MNKTYGEETLGQTLWHFLPGILKFLSVLGIGLVIFNVINISLSTGQADRLSDSTKTSYPLIRTYNLSVGNKESKVKYVYFVDYQCPVCGANSETMQQLKLDYKDRIEFVYKNYPITTAHVYAESAARSVQAANVQGKGMELAEVILSRQSDGFSSEKFATWAQELGLDMDQFTKDRGNSTTAAQVKLDQSDYDSSSLPKSTLSDKTKAVGETGGTPTSVIIKDGKVIDWWSGKAEITTIKAKLDEYLK